MIGRDRIQYKSHDQVRAMRRAGLLVAQLAVRDLGAVALAATLIGTAAAVGFVWLNPDQRTGVAGLGLVLGVLLLGTMGLLGVVAR